MAGMKQRIKIDKEIHAFHKELDELSCPICMEHPHNAVLLLCSSHEKGCRPYICDTSYRHSNCLDRFKKLWTNSRSISTSSSSLAPNTHSSTNTSNANLALRADFNEANENPYSSESNVVSSLGLTGEPVADSIQDYGRHQEARGSLAAGDSSFFQQTIDHEELAPETSQVKQTLKCPLCRGTVLGWKVVEEARKYLNMKKRSCSRESCSFSGNYQELRRHARRVHPSIRPSNIDPSRERAWRHLEHQREYDDVVSAIRSAIPGAVMVGDYVIENGGRFPFEREGGSGQSGPWWTTFFFRMIDSASSGESRSRSRAWPRRRHRRWAGSMSERQNLWGESLLGLQDDGDPFHIPSDVSEDSSPVPRRRRRLTRSRYNEDQP